MLCVSNPGFSLRAFHLRLHSLRLPGLATRLTLVVNLQLRKLLMRVRSEPVTRRGDRRRRKVKGTENTLVVWRLLRKLLKEVSK